MIKQENGTGYVPNSGASPRPPAPHGEQLKTSLDKVLLPDSPLSGYPGNRGQAVSTGPVSANTILRRLSR